MKIDYRKCRLVFRNNRTSVSIDRFDALLAIDQYPMWNPDGLVEMVEYVVDYSDIVYHEQGYVEV